MIKEILENNEIVKHNKNEMEILHKYFSQCFNNESKFDIDKFQSIIKEDVDIIHEGYEFNFLGKNYAKLLASIDTTTILQPDIEHNNKPENINSQNIYISGDNYEGLKHLLNSYASKVKCIYIDPPYNTGSDGFVYNDKFNFTIEELCVKLSINEEQATKILELTKRGAASHSAWLMFMFTRLQLAKDLLTDDGSIFISIDNNEYANLKLLCDTVFGEENFIEMFSWVKTSTPPSLSIKSRKTNEYILCYERYKSDYKYNGELLDGGDQPLLNSGNLKRVLIFPKDKVYFSSSSMQKTIEPYSSSKVSLLNRINVTNGYADCDIKLEGEFKWSKEFLDQELEKGTTFVIKRELLSIRFIRQQEGWKRPTNFIKKSIITPLIDKPSNNVDTNEAASSDLINLMGAKVFNFPKPVSLIKYLINFNIANDDIVVDFFSGSATTAEAVLNLNLEKKRLKYILIQLPEDMDENLKFANAENKVVLKNGIDLLDSIGKSHKLDEIGQERIKRAARRIQDKKIEDIDYGFKHYTLVEPSTDTIDQIETFDPNAIFADENILDQFGRDSVLETWLVKDGYGFGAKFESIKLNTYTVYLFGKHLYFIDTEFSEFDMVALIDRYHKDPKFNPENLVIFGYSFIFTQLEMLRKNIVVLKDSSKNLKPNIDIRY